jgi:polysaccharide deacetylase family protein (PEP-CTERM system associated)
MPVTFTIDLEDPTERYAPEGRYVALARRLLDLCDEMRCRATFFTVGRVAEASPQLVRDITERGHEIAYHSHAHVPLTEENPERFRSESLADKDRLEQLARKPVIGYRAPRFSLTPQSAWALDILADLGFRYSSSIMPTGASLYGFKNAPRKAFRWPNGLIEFPLPVACVGPCRIPYLGGIYLYALPSVLARFWLNRAAPDEVLWTYTHPYDFDREEAFAPMPHAQLWISFVLWSARRFAEGKIRMILAHGAEAPLGERLAPQERYSPPPACGRG